MMPSMHCAKEKPDAAVIITLLLHVSGLLDLSCLTILYPENEALKKVQTTNCNSSEKSIVNAYLIV